MPGVLGSRVIRAVVLLLALGLGGLAGAPAMALPPRAGVTISGLDDDDDDRRGGGGGGDGGSGDDPVPPPPVPARVPVPG